MNKKLKDIILREDYPCAFRRDGEKTYECSAKEGYYKLTSFSSCKNCSFRVKLNDLKKKVEDYPIGRFGNCHQCPYGKPSFNNLK